MNNEELVVVSRNSTLAIKQVDEIFNKLPHIGFRHKVVYSYGDKHKDISLFDKRVCPDFFTRELDQLLLDDDAEIAIHSAKDVPYPLPDGLEIIALTFPDDRTDSIVLNKNLKFTSIKDLPADTVIGTSSESRKLELEKLNSNLILKSIRGTIKERIQQMDDGKYDGVIIATCALKRLGLHDRICRLLNFRTHPLQGSLAVVAKQGRKDLISIFKDIDIRQSFGKVYLLGAGPGSPDLMTIKGRTILEEADIILYDDLIDVSILNHSINAELIYVGKRKNVHSKEQSEINYLMVMNAMNGKKVVRLKGGDPMIFAHGGEEIEYLQSNQIEVEVIPGISTANALASLCKIPLTHREIASSLAFVSGHALYGLKLPHVDTLVLYMAGTKIHKIALKMIAEGWNKGTPVVLVYNVSMPNQEEYFSTLEDLSKNDNKYPTPIIIVVGQVVALRNNTAKQINNESRLLITGLDTTPYMHLGKTIHSPLIEIQFIEENKELEDKINNLQEYQSLLFTSRNAVQGFFKSLYKLGKDTRSLKHLNICSIGQMTTIELLKYGLLVDNQSTTEDSSGVISMFQENRIDGKILNPRSDLSLEIISNGLKNIGLDIDSVVAYNNVMPTEINKIDLSTIDTIVFTSPSCVKNFIKVYEKIPLNIKIIARGSTTFDYLLKLNIPKEQIFNFALNRKDN